jgi:hypothetical protein
MTQVILRYAPEDFQAVHPIIEALSEAGLQVAEASRRGINQLELDITEHVAIDFGVTNCVVVVWSRAAAQSRFVEFELRHAMAAWSSDRLVLATLDDTPLPVGLRDLPAISISTNAPDSGKNDLIEHVVATVKPRPVFAEPKKISEEGLSTALSDPLAIVRLDDALPSAASAPTCASPRSYSWAIIPAGTLSVVCGAVLIAMLLAMFIREPEPTADLPNIIPPSVMPPSFPPSADILPERSDTSLVLGFIAIMFFVGAAVGGGAVWVSTAWSPRRVTRRLAAPSAVPLMSQTPSPPPSGPPEVFVSYSRKDATNVERLVKQIEQLGYAVWIDRQSGGSQRYAAPIVQAIRMSRLIALMCSQNAFASDHVVREIYVAGDCKKPFIAFQLDLTDFPDEILYFLSGFPRIPIASIDQQQLRSEIARLVTPNLH